VRVQGGTIRLSQKNTGALFEPPDNICLHLKNINKEGELNVGSVADEFPLTANSGKITLLNIATLIRLSPSAAARTLKRAATFRHWATGILRYYTPAGYAIDRKRMENGAFLNDGYFERLNEEIHAIRLSERWLYQTNN
jgi:hypothetical protein